MEDEASEAQATLPSVNNNTSEMSLMEEMVRKVMGEMMDSFKLTLRKEFNDLKDSLEWVESQNIDIKKRCKENEDKTEHLDSKVKKLEAEMAKERSKRIMLECEYKKRNLILYGIEESLDGHETMEQLEGRINKFLEEQLNTAELMIESCYRLGQLKKKNQVTRPIKIQFCSVRDRDKVWMAKKFLKGTKIYIKEDLPIEIEKENAILNPIYKAARAKGMTCKLNRGRLHINGELYTSETLNRLPKDLQPEELANRTTNQEIFFWGTKSILSNFHKCPIQDGEIKYNCVEQFYTAERARFFNDNLAVEKILQTDDPVQQKQTRISNMKEADWEVVAEETMLKCIRAKFEQNEPLKKLLIDTHPKELVEANPHDAKWGIGLGMWSPHIHERKAWGENRTGKILMKVRDLLIKQ
jgi:ribA/ribD-fused uncharacterized protein